MTPSLIRKRLIHKVIPTLGELGTISFSYGRTLLLTPAPGNLVSSMTPCAPYSLWMLLYAHARDEQ